MQMGMRGESLSPGMQDAEEADPDTQAPGIGRDRSKSFGRSPEQQIVHLAFVLQGQGGQWCWQRKHDMKIVARQELGLAFFQPLRSGQRLAPGTMPIGARVVGIPFVAALVTSFQMTAQRRGATQFDRAQHSLLLSGQRSSMCSAKLVAVRAHDIGDFQGRPHVETVWDSGSTMGRGSRSRGLVVAQTVVVARRR